MRGAIAGSATAQYGSAAWPQNQQHLAGVTQTAGASGRTAARLKQEALRAGRTLLTLDTRAGDKAEQLYRSMAWIEYGRIPGYAVQVDGSFEETLFFWKQLTRG